MNLLSCSSSNNDMYPSSSTCSHQERQCPQEQGGGEEEKCFLWCPKEQEQEPQRPRGGPAAGLLKQDQQRQQHSSVPLFLFNLLCNENWDIVREYLQLPSPAYSSLRTVDKLLSPLQDARRGKDVGGEDQWQKYPPPPFSPLLLCQQRDHTNLTCLALALALDAPLDIIEGMVKINPSLPSVIDDYCATVLHVACLNGASLESIEFILSLNNNEYLLRQLDMDNRSVLHQAVEFACHEITKRISSCPSSSCTTSTTSSSSSLSSSLGNNVTQLLSSIKKRKFDFLFTNSYRKKKRDTSSKTTRVVLWSEVEEEHEQSTRSISRSNSNYYQVIQKLCEVAPEMVHVQDKQGETPIDVVQLIKAAVDCKENPEEYKQLQHIYKILRDTSVDLYKKNKMQWEQKERIHLNQ